MVPIEYDPLLAKIIARAETREAAIQKMRCAVAETFIGGIKTSVGFFRRLLGDEQFRAGDIHTGFIQEFLARPAAKLTDGDVERVAALVAAVRAREKPATSQAPRVQSRWLSEGRDGLLR